MCVFCVFAGSPPATGTGTLVIYLEDYNDNAPYVVPSVARVCEDAHDMNVAIVGGRDKDLTPNAAPFKIELGTQPGLDKTWKITRVNCECFILKLDFLRETLLCFFVCYLYCLKCFIYVLLHIRKDL